MNNLKTVWSDTPDTSAYPRPQMVRDSYFSLDGKWDYKIVKGDLSYMPSESEIYDGKISVPFSPESMLSGVNRTLMPEEVLIYRTVFTKQADGIALLHFGAVDYKCKVYVNGNCVAGHTGGYTPFECEIQKFIKDGENELVVCVTDPSDTMPVSRGKQAIKNGGIWYTPQSGIWGTVWTEEVPQDYIENVTCFADPDSAQVNVNVTACGDIGELTIKIYDEGKEIISAKGACGDNFIKMNAIKMWSPSSPFLYNVLIKSKDDSVRTYFAMRKVELVTDMRGYKRVKLNGEYIFQSGVLD